MHYLTLPNWKTTVTSTEHYCGRDIAELVEFLMATILVTHFLIRKAWQNARFLSSKEVNYQLKLNICVKAEGDFPLRYKLILSEQTVFAIHRLVHKFYVIITFLYTSTINNMTYCLAHTTTLR